MLTTIQEANVYVLEGLNKGNSSTVPPVEFDVLWNAATMHYVRQKAQVVEKDEQALDALRVLIPPELVIANSGTPTPGGEIFLLPFIANPPLGTSQGYLFMLNVAVKLLNYVPLGLDTPVDCALPDGFVPARVQRRDARYDNEQDPFWKPTVEEPYYYTTGNQMRVRATATTYATQARIEYIRYPVKASLVNSINPEFPPHINLEIADLAIRRQLEIMESPRYPSNTREGQLNN